MGSLREVSVFERIIANSTLFNKSTLSFSRAKRHFIPGILIFEYQKVAMAHLPTKYGTKWILLAQLTIIMIISHPLATAAVENIPPTGVEATKPLWFWPVILFVFCFVLGILAVLSGVGGGALYVPLVSGFFPFHIDFVRGAGLMVALAGSLAAGRGYYEGTWPAFVWLCLLL